MALSTSQLRSAWAPACTPDMVTLTLWSRAKVRVRAEAADAFRALDTVMKAHGYFQRPEDTGAFNCRAITGGTGYSLHAYGIAQDTNWRTNPYGPRLVTDRSRAMVDDILAIRTRNGAQVFGWGGYYAGSKDAMHDEVVCSPADLASGIDPRSVVTLNTQQEDDMPPGPASTVDEFGRVWQFGRVGKHLWLCVVDVDGRSKLDEWGPVDDRGEITSDPSAVTLADHRIKVTARGTDSAMHAIILSPNPPGVGGRIGNSSGWFSEGGQF